MQKFIRERKGKPKMYFSDEELREHGVERINQFCYLIPCEKCGRMMVIKYGRYGKFLACPGYPECKNAKPWVETIDVPCPKCGAKVQVRKTKRKRNYYICENNPASCDYISWTKPKKGEKYVENQDGEEISKEVKKTTSKKKKAKKTGAKKTTAKKTTKRASTRKKKNSEET